MKQATDLLGIGRTSSSDLEQAGAVMLGPYLRGVYAGGDEPIRPRLRGGGGGPGWMRSGAGEEGPERDMPYAGEGGPDLAGLIEAGVGPMCTGSGAGVGAPRRNMPR